MWALAAGYEPIDPHVVNTLLALVALTAWIVPIINGIRNLTKKSRGESPVTFNDMEGEMTHLNGKIDSVRRDMLEKAKQSKEYHDENKHKLDHCVTREELLDSRNALITPLLQTMDSIKTSVKEHGESQHQLRERVDTMGKDLERGLSQVRIILSKLQERMRLFMKDDKSGDSSDD